MGRCNNPSQIIFVGNVEDEEKKDIRSNKMIFGGLTEPLVWYMKKRGIDSFKISNSVLFILNLFRLIVFTDILMVVQLVAMTLDTGLSQLHQQDANLFSNYHSIYIYSNRNKQ